LRGATTRIRQPIRLVAAGADVEAFRMPLRSFVLVSILAVALPRSAAAQAVAMGSPLLPGVVPNLSIDCAAQPAIADPSGAFGLFNSGVADCTWRQAGVFGVQNDTRFSSVPGDGRITSVTIRSGPTPAPLSIVILRQLSTPGFGAESHCCFFVSETPRITLTPNATQTFPVDIPVVRNTINGYLAVDLVAVSAASGTGTLPLAQVGPINAFNLTTPGSVNAGFFYPRVGALPNDSGGGRREDGIPGIELLMQWTWCPAGAGGGAGVCLASGGAGPALRSANAALQGRRALLDLACNGDALCRGLAEILVAGAITRADEIDVASAAASGGRYGKKKFKIQPGTNVVLGVPLSGKAKKLLKTNGSLAATLRLTPKAGTPVTAAITITK
jgi:hypothetical protein